MARVQAKSKIDAARDLLIAWQFVVNGITVQTTKERGKYWKTWTIYYEECNVKPYLDTIKPYKRTIIIKIFVARVQTRDYGNGSQVHV